MIVFKGVDPNSKYLFTKFSGMPLRDIPRSCNLSSLMSGDYRMLPVTALHQLTDALFHNIASAGIAPLSEINVVLISEAGIQSSVVY